jgi:hypothetical protein
MTSEPAKARPARVDVRTDVDTGSRHVNIREGSDYVILTASRHASDSLIDAAARIAKTTKGVDK